MVAIRIKRVKYIALSYTRVVRVGILCCLVSQVDYEFRDVLVIPFRVQLFFLEMYRGLLYM